MDGLLEIGEIGIKHNIPAELSQLSNENIALKIDNKRLKGIMTIVGVILGIYLTYETWQWLKKKYPENE